MSRRRTSNRFLARVRRGEGKHQNYSAATTAAMFYYRNDWSVVLDAISEYLAILGRYGGQDMDVVSSWTLRLIRRRVIAVSKLTEKEGMSGPTGRPGA